MTALFVVALVVAAVAGVRGTWSPCGLSMVSSINPFSEHARGHRYPLTAAWFVLGAVVGGLVPGAVGAALALLTADLDVPVLAGIGAAAALVTLAADLGPARLPTHPRQVDERWLDRYRRWIYASGFGAQIGAGFATYIMTAATYLVPVLAALTGSPVRALLVGATFGLVRGLGVLLSARAVTPARLRAVVRTLARLEPASRHVSALTQALAAVVLAGLAAGGWGVAAALAMLVAVLGVGVGRARAGTRPISAGSDRIHDGVLPAPLR